MYYILSKITHKSSKTYKEGHANAGLLWLYCNDLKFLESFQTAPGSANPVSTCIFWTRYSMVEIYCSNIRTITAIFSGVRIFKNHDTW